MQEGRVTLHSSIQNVKLFIKQMICCWILNPLFFIWLPLIVLAPVRGLKVFRNYRCQVYWVFLWTSTYLLTGCYVSHVHQKWKCDHLKALLIRNDFALRKQWIWKENCHAKNLGLPQVVRGLKFRIRKFLKTRKMNHIRCNKYAEWYIFRDHYL